MRLTATVIIPFMLDILFTTLPALPTSERDFGMQNLAAHTLEIRVEYNFGRALSAYPSFPAFYSNLPEVS